MVDAFFYPVTNRAHRTMKMLINDYTLLYRTLEKHGCWYRLYKFLSVCSISGLLSQDRQQSPLCRFRTCDFTDRVESIRVFCHRGNYIVQRRGSNKLTFYKRKTRCNNETKQEILLSHMNFTIKGLFESQRERDASIWGPEESDSECMSF